ncbi:MAG: inositol monophosphatase, partial [Candidatus Aenigmatarchaeota archaeon]
MIYKSMDFRNVAIKVVKESGKVLNENFGHVKGIRIKMGDWRELVTDVDMKANDIIIQMLKENFPDHGIVSEESEPIEGNDYKWYVDPLDGTTNYTLGIPFSATCVGLVLRGTPILGVVFNPMMNELFVGEDGKGATLNGEKIQVS